MNIIGLLLIILFLSILSVPLTIKMRVPLEIFLLIASGIISLLPGLPLIEIKPWVVFYIFLPPILFSAAYFTSWHDFKLNRLPIILLAFGLVFATAIVIAVFAQYLFPGFGWAQGFLLGAILSPTDATAATSLIKKLGAPRRLIAILEGESLINDATALLIFRFSLIAIITGTFSFPLAVGNFLSITIGGFVIGLVLGISGLLILKRLNNVQAETTLTLVLAYACYVLAEYFHCSGVIATVTGGIYLGMMIPAHGHSRTRLSARSTWGTILFIINVLVFSLIGLELSWVIRNLGEFDKINLILSALFFSVIILLVRMTWVFLVAYLTKKFLHSHSNTKNPELTAPMLFIIGWGGMRGIVSFAAVLAIPTYIGTTLFPYREVLIYITYWVIVITLVVPTLSIPYLLSIFKLANIENTIKEEAVARLKASRNVLVSLMKTAKEENIPQEIYEDYLHHVEKRIEVIQTQLEDTPYSTLPIDFFMTRKLILSAINAERMTLLELRKIGDIHEEVFRSLMEELDLEEVRAHSLRV